MKTPEQFLALLSGAWLLQNESSVYPNGTTLPRPDSVLGPNPTSYMSAILVPTLPAYRPLSLHYGRFENTTDAEWAVLGQRNLAYAAPFSLSVLPEADEDDGVVMHGPLMCNVPSYDGVYFERNFTVLGTGEEYGRWLRLALRGQEGVRVVLVWRKRE
ncbi:hypothetical protein BU23DRAFT_596829 [Bimuria novae-zelandiae CBS 107.79]|uniref:Lipocalin-like domain-containing protein n=1 Tax=Bimuria novae-zelandiae CBS 107.79 TaxID=1447943 RepID=A0A6A5VJR2_9PLEO|nr:hypothetical protein BU23DRAFT_596829 [Bimuria novae-zelandiae CBS 107.79]